MTGTTSGTNRAAPARALDAPPPAPAAPRSHAAVRDPGRGRPGRWWARFIFWAAVLSVPCWVLADAYHAGLRAAASFLLGLNLPHRAPDAIEVQATHVLGIYAAMCLASVRASLRRRLLAIAVGLPALFALDLLTGIIAIRTEMLAAAGRALPQSLERFRDQAIGAPPWLGAPVLWLLLLGPRQIGDGSRARSATRRQP